MKGTITICDIRPAVFNLASATYNLIERDDPSRFELTFRCDSHQQENTASAPKLEMTIVLDAAPQLSAGNDWANQPGYIDLDNLWNVISFYEWTHENLEEFTLKIGSSGKRVGSGGNEVEFAEVKKDGDTVVGEVAKAPGCGLQ